MTGAVLLVAVSILALTPLLCRAENASGDIIGLYKVWSRGDGGASQPFQYVRYETGEIMSGRFLEGPILADKDIQIAEALQVEVGAAPVSALIVKFSDGTKKKVGWFLAGSNTTYLIVVGGVPRGEISGDALYRILDNNQSLRTVIPTKTSAEWSDLKSTAAAINEAASMQR